MDYRAIRVDLHKQVATLTFNRPDSLNALSKTLIEETREVIVAISNRAIEARALILTGAGRAFSSGADLSDPAEVFSGPRDRRDLGSALEAVYHPLLMAIRNAQVPIVAAVKGPCAGAAMSIALSSDMIIAGESAYFLQAFKAIGLVPDAGATFILPRLVGRARAMELSMLGQRLPAAKAMEWGMINKVVPDEAVLSEAQKLAQTLAEGPTRALVLTRQLFLRSETATYEEQLNAERMAQREASQTEDAEEGVKSFHEKRPPHFQGR